MRISAKKQQPKVQTIQRTAIRDVTQHNGNINNFWKGSRWFCCHKDLLLFHTTRIKKMAVWKTSFVSEHLKTDQFQLTKCFALVVCFACCSLCDSS